METIQARACPFLFKSFQFKPLRPIGIALLVAGMAHAVTITVSCSGSSGGSAGLIAAINTANSTSGANTINLTPGCIYTLIAQYPGQSLNGLPPITGTLTVNGYGATIERSHAEGTPSFRIFAVDAFPPVSGNLTLNFVKVEGGRVLNNDIGFPCEDGTDANGNPFFDAGFGGGICVDIGGTLTLNHSAVTRNVAFNTPDTVFEYNKGGGIYNGGSTRLNDSVINDNIAEQSFASSNPAEGGGIFNGLYGKLILERTVVTRNTATVIPPNNCCGLAEGGGMFSAGVLIMRQSVVSGNRASFDAQSGEVWGGGIAIDVGGTATLYESAVIDNIARISSSTTSPSAPIAEGGGLYVLGTATLDRSLVFANRAEILQPASSGGTASGGGITASGTVTLVHTGVRCNVVRAPAQAKGGGIDAVAAILRFSEVVENGAEGGTLADSLGGGIYSEPNGSVALTDTKVKDNHPNQCDPTGSVPGCSN